VTDQAQSGDWQPSDGHRPRFDVFLSHNSRDKPLVEQIAVQLKREGYEPWLDAWSLVPGQRWQPSLADGVLASSALAYCLGPHGQGDWARTELDLALDRATKDDEAFRLFPVLLPGLPEPFDAAMLPPFLRMRTWVDLRSGVDSTRGFQDLVCAIKGLPFGPGVPIEPRDDVCPYRGLEPFGEEDAGLFFGRDGEVQRLLEKLKGSRFLAVLGPSGSGKSSLTRAGLIPALKRGLLPGSETWTVRVVKPGAHPLDSLSRQIVDLAPSTELQAARDRLPTDRRALDLVAALALAGRPDDARLLWVVDQFEELFTLHTEETDLSAAERQAFLANLLYAAGAPGGRSIVVLTLRADFYHRCAAYPELATVLADHQMLVSPMDRADLRRAIVEPARQVGLTLEPGLTETVLADVADRPGALPLLEHALLETWERRRAGMLTLEGYRESGGVEGALAQRADEVFDGFSPAEQAVTRRVLLRLIQPGDGTEDTRRRAPLAEMFTSPADRPIVERVVQALADARLLTTSTSDAAGVVVVDVAHEALIRGWPRLRGWLDDHRAALRVHRRLTDAAFEWEQRQRDPNVLYRGVRLAEALQWQRQHDADLNDLERAFVSASAARERRERRNVVGASLTVAAFGIVLALVAGYQWWQADLARNAAVELTRIALEQRQIAEDGRQAASDAEARAEGQRQAAEEQRQIAVEAQARSDQQRRLLLSRQVAADALALFPRQPELGLLLSVEAHRTVETPDALASLLAGRRLGPHLIATLDDASGRSFEHVRMVFSPDGRLLATTTNYGLPRVWDVNTHILINPDLKLARRSDSGVPHDEFDVAFSADGRQVSSVGFGSGIWRWDVTTGQQANQPVGLDPPGVTVAALSRDGRLLATSGGDNTPRIRDASTGSLVGDPLAGQIGQVTALAFSSDGRLLAAGSEDRTVRLWDVASQRLIGRPLIGHGGAVTAVAFSPSGDLLAAANVDHTIRLWDLKTGELIGKPMKGHTDAVVAVAFSPDGKQLASGSNDRTARLWDLHTREPIADTTIEASDAVQNLAFSPDGQVLATGGAGKVYLWQIGGLRSVAQIFDSQLDGLTRVTFGQNGQQIMAFGSDGRAVRDSIIRWDLTGRVLGDPIPLSGPTLGLSPDGRLIAVRAHDDTTYGGPFQVIQIWDTTRQPVGQVGRTLVRSQASPDLDVDVQKAAFSLDGNHLAAMYSDTITWLWDIGAGQQTCQGAANDTGPFGTVTFGPDSRLLAFSGRDNAIRLWAPATCQVVGDPFVGHTSIVGGLAFSPDGRLLASSSADHTVRLWDVATRQPVGEPLDEPIGAPNFLAFSADSRLLATAGPGNSIRLWDVRTRQPIGQPLAGHTDRVTSVAFGPTGLLVSSSEDGTVRLWDLTPASANDDACRRANRNLTLEEWQKYLPGEEYRVTCPGLPAP
jgi:WD40 repeat protein